MKKTILPVLIVLFAMNVKAQETKLSCGSTPMEKEALKQYPEIATYKKELEQFTKDFIKNKNETNAKSSAVDAPYIIPVVFHIIHTYGQENISDAQVKDAMRILNLDFMKLNSDTTVVNPEFKPLIGKANMQFRLATKDVAGNCTNGIEHIYSYKTNIAGDDGKLNPWQRDRYLNIWVVNKMISGAAAYAYKPASVNVTGVFSTKDGIITLSDYVGSIGTGSPNGKARTLTHEIGHWLNLDHTWGGTNEPMVECGNDGIEDTPVTKGYNFCPNRAASAVCDTAIFENYQNYMDYSYCNIMFTKGQIDHMVAAIESSVSGRNNLWKQTNLEITGTPAPYEPALCAPLADFYPERQFGCAGDQIKFFDKSQRAAVESRLWSVPGATPETSTAATPTFTFPNPGKYTVSLTSTNATGSDTRTSVNFIDIRGSYNDYTVPFVEDFSDVNKIQSQWSNNDLFSDDHYWKHNSNAGFGGSGGALYFNNWEADNGNYDELISPSFNLQYATNMKLNFKYSVSTYASDLLEELKVFGSVNCGKTWTLIKSIKGDELFSAGQWNASYMANQDQFWADASLTLGSTYKKPNVRFKLVFVGTGNGNNAWIDNFGIDGTVGIDDNTTAITYLTVYPNPSVGEVGIRFEQLNNEKAKVKVLNMLGEIVYSQDLGYLNAGDHEVKINSDLSNGLYVLILESGQSKLQSRFVVSK